MATQLTISPVISASAAAFPVAPATTDARSRSVPGDQARATKLIGGGSPRVATAQALAPPAAPAAPGRRDVRVLSLNIQVDAAGGRLPAIVAMIRQSNADIIGLQECGAETGREIARQLGYHVVQAGDDTPVLSRYPIEPQRSGQHGVTVKLPDNQRILFVNLHLNHAPYQPFQLLRIPYANGRFISTEAEAISEARAARGAEVDRVVTELDARDRDVPAVVVCDCNQPSHLDWTAKAVAAGLQPLPVRWPESAAIVGAGFTDAYRRLFPDEVARPGFTWTPGLDPKNPTDHADRLDFVYSDTLVPRDARILGESAATSDVVVTPYPTDHRGVLVDYSLPR